MKKLRDYILENYFIEELFDPEKREIIETLLAEADRIDNLNWWEKIHQERFKEWKKIKKDIGEVRDILYKRFVENPEFYK